MSKDFSLILWVANLPSPNSCITSNRRKSHWEYDGPDNYSARWTYASPDYYALAQDRRGKHCPHPKLPKWAKRLFELRVRVGMLLKQTIQVRGSNWWFHCPHCADRSFFTFRNHRCYMCGTYFDGSLQPVNRFYVVDGKSYRGVNKNGRWEYEQLSPNYARGDDDIHF